VNKDAYIQDVRPAAPHFCMKERMDIQSVLFIWLVDIFCVILMSTPAHWMCLHMVVLFSHAHCWLVLPLYAHLICLLKVVLIKTCTRETFTSWPHGAIFNVNVFILIYYAHKKYIVLLIVFVVFNIKLGEMISVCVSVLLEHFQHILTIPR
jgi:hypothetical protein